MIRQFELVERIRAYDPYVNEELINKAYVFAMKAHGTQKRASGDPYFSHPLEVAGILTNLNLDWQSIVTALLHDTVEDTLTTLDELECLFGKDIARLVDGVTKLSKLEQQSVEKTQAENFRKLLLAMSKDIRVLLVKLADRLHNMRTLHHLKSNEKKQRIATETMEIFAPLAGRIGLQDMQTELEDLAFSFINPKARDSIETRLTYLREQGENTVQEIIQSLQQTLRAGGVAVEVYGRQKSPYSIWQKMQQKNVPFEHLSDIVGFRVLVESLSGCYQTLGLIHHAYTVVPGRFKDYISTPKPNGYKSLHTTVLIPPFQRVEIQIRTFEMHRESELGVAAHWVYKQDGSIDINSETTRYEWLRALLEILEQATDPSEFLEHTKLEMFGEQVFCFSPKGDLKAMPRGATPIDFAYAVHSDIGNQCTGAKINGKLSPLKTELNNGDQVEIITSPNHEPSPTWERYVVTGKAKAHIRRFIKQKERDQYTNLGHTMLLKSTRKYGLSYREENLQKRLPAFRADNIADIYALVGKGALSAQNVLTLLYPDKFGIQPSPEKSDAKILSKEEKSRDDIEKNTDSIINGLIPGMAIHYAKCCHPIPGDTIIGVVTTGRGVTIHKSECLTLNRFKDTPDRLLDLSWGKLARKDRAYLARIRVTIMNRPGSLGNLSTSIGKMGSNISNLKINSRGSDFFDLILDIEVESQLQLNDIITHLRATRFINQVRRI